MESPKTKIAMISQDLKKKIVQDRLCFLMDRIVNDFSLWLQSNKGEEELDGICKIFPKLNKNYSGGIAYERNTPKIFNEMINQLDKELQTKEVLLCTSLIWGIAGLFQEVNRVGENTDVVKGMESFLRRNNERNLDLLIGRIRKYVDVLMTGGDLGTRELFCLYIDMELLLRVIPMQKK